MNERRCLQVAVCVACIVPIGAGLAGVIFGSSFLGWIDDANASGRALDSHTRYLSGLLLAIGLAFLSAVPAIERHSARFTLLTSIVFVGGLTRLAGLAVTGIPPKGMIFGLIMELVITPLLCVWQRRVSQSPE
ncbi:MAG: DUF4345 domain-containing protein [Hyphomicrobiales bacterium]|nr:MAG: DUF4345 domain-containing protein [Hyphomicrobiales bacterium]